MEYIVAVFTRKFVKLCSHTHGKHKWHKLIFDPNTMKFPDLPEKQNQVAEEKTFRENAQAMIDSLLYAKLPPK